MDKITTALGELVDAEPYLRRVSSLPLRSKEVPEGLSPKANYHIVKLGRLVAAETKHFTDIQAELFAALGIMQGQSLSDLKPGVWKSYLQQIKPHTDIVVTLDWGPIQYADIPLALAADILGLGPLCEWVDEDEKPPK